MNQNIMQTIQDYGNHCEENKNFPMILHLERDFENIV